MPLHKAGIRHAGIGPKADATTPSDVSVTHPPLKPARPASQRSPALSTAPRRGGGNAVTPFALRQAALPSVASNGYWKGVWDVGAALAAEKSTMPVESAPRVVLSPRPASRSIPLAKGKAVLERLRRQHKNHVTSHGFEKAWLKGHFLREGLPKITSGAAALLASYAANQATGLIQQGLSRAFDLTVAADWMSGVVGNPPPPNTQAGIPSVLTSLAGQTVYNTVATGIVNGVDQFRAMGSEIPTPGNIAAQHLHAAVVDRWAGNDAELHPVTLRQLQALDNQYLDATMHGSSEAMQHASRLLDRRVELSASNPGPKRSRAHLKSPEVVKALDDIAAFFPESTAEALKRRFFRRLGDPKHPRPAVMLYGKPGSGKTQLIGDIARAVDRPVIEVDLKTLLGDDFWGRPNDWSLQDIGKSIRSAAGILLSEQMKHGRSDVIIVVNEAHFGSDETSDTVAAVKRIMDSVNFASFENNGVPRKIDALFIFTSNLRNDSIQALVERIPSVTVECGERQRMHSADKTLAGELAELEKAETPGFAARVRASAMACREVLRERGNHFDCGMRVMNDVVDNLVSRIADELRAGVAFDLAAQHRKIGADFEDHIAKALAPSIDRPPVD